MVITKSLKDMCCTIIVTYSARGPNCLFVRLLACQRVRAHHVNRVDVS